MAEQKYCTRPGCGKPIKWPPFVPGVKSHPLNMDGTEHNCSQETEKPKENARVGTFSGISLGRINLTLKAGGILQCEATPDLIKCLESPDTAIKNGMKIKVFFGKDGKAEKTEICPDQPSPVLKAQVTDEWKEPVKQQENPKETRTSPKDTPAATETSVEDQVRNIIAGMNPSDKVGFRISLAVMVNSVIEIKKTGKVPIDTEEVKREALALLLWCDGLTTQNLKGVR